MNSTKIEIPRKNLEVNAELLERLFCAISAHTEQISLLRRGLEFVPWKVVLGDGTAPNVNVVTQRCYLDSIININNAGAVSVTLQDGDGIGAAFTLGITGAITSLRIPFDHGIRVTSINGGPLLLAGTIRW